MSPAPHATSPPVDPKSRPFRRAVLRGLGVVMPPLLTLVLFIWAWNAIEMYVLKPVNTGIRHTVVWTISDTLLSRPAEADLIEPGNPAAGFRYRGRLYVADPTGKRFLPAEVVQYVNEHLERIGPYQPAPATANAYWHRYVELRYLPRSVVVPVFLLVFLAILYFIGRLFTHGLGHWFLNQFDRLVSRLPVVSNVYGSVKQVTDFVFSDRDIEFNRVVAVEYPRKGLWSIGFVTGSSMADIAAAANEPVLSVLMPTSPMPMTGFTITVRKSEAVDLDLTIDQAIQFVVSCGVVVPPQQQQAISDRLPLNLPDELQTLPEQERDVPSNRDATSNSDAKPQEGHDQPRSGLG